MKTSALRSALLTLALVLSVDALAQDQSYIGDEVFVVLHAGPGTNYRWVSKLTPEQQGQVTEATWESQLSGPATC